MIKLYDSKLSGNAWKIRLMLNFLQIPYTRETLNLAEGKHKEESFKKRNPFARIPVVELADGRHLNESNAILLYFAEGSSLLPADPVMRCKINAWLFFEQADLLRFLAYPRFYTMTNQREKFADIIAHYMELGKVALTHVNQALEKSSWIAGESLSVADFSLYPYISMAEEGGYTLAEWPAIQRWIGNFKDIPGYENLVNA
ncbi:glutathione S-transferase family protein [Pantoea cypripedii]|uniref:glutathione S-transferase family protein n=1 Tax=Pantoea cypripedii TaxID=55209 RepID=UPI002FC94E02